MKISGSSTLESPVDKVWEAIQDPAVLARTLPGCESLAVIGEDRYAMSVVADDGERLAAGQAPGQHRGVEHRLPHLVDGGLEGGRAGDLHRGPSCAGTGTGTGSVVVCC